MLKKIKYFIILILVVSAIILGYFISLESTYTIVRKRKIEAPSNMVFLQISDLKKWNNWSSIKEKDSTVRFEFQKSTKKEGDYFRFTDSEGDRQKLTNLTLAPDSLIVQSLSSGEEVQQYKWQIVPDKASGVIVKWEISGELPFWKRMNTNKMDELIGPNMTRGLELLDKAVHKDMEKHETEILKVSDLSATYYIYKSVSCKMDSLGSKMDKLLPEVLIYAIKSKIEMNGKVFTIYNKWDENNNSVIFSSCVPTKEKIAITDADILTGQTPGGAYLKIKFIGDYKFLRSGWQKGYEYIAHNKSIIQDLTREPFEIYVLGHTKSLNPADWITEIYIPVLKIEAPKQNIQ